ncbi:MAG: glycogen debranching protein GlgX [Archangium sp.]
MTREIWPGRPYPLGATWDGEGTNFAVFSENARGMTLCLFDENGHEERIAMKEQTAFCWHVYLPNVKPGQRYAFRARGEWKPEAGLRFCENKLLIDPYALAIEGDVKWNEALFTHTFGGDPKQLNDADSAAFLPKSVVVDQRFDWGNDQRPRTPWHETIIYEAHVKGLTQRIPGLPDELRGTYAGVGHPATIEHLRTLGITALELMPTHHFVHDSHLLDKGLRNYWGYNTIGFMAPHAGYASSGQRGQQVQEFKAMVRALHEAGIEVILDVVYNHSAEGNHQGPTLSFKGLDNQAYYRLAEDPFYFQDYTGTGNTFNMLNAHVLQLLMDSLRYWTTEMHVDGFRFDLAAALARGLHEAGRLSAFFDLIHQDPVCRDVKLIAEPWDVGPGRYQVGNFPPLWTEWNGKFRDVARDFWRGAEGTMAEFASRLTGSSDLYEHNGRRPYASINFVTAHDGFTLRDLVSFNDKHNDANGEENRDGESHNRSCNCGAEGPTDDAGVNKLRAQQQRNLLATVMLSQGVPMVLHGDELGRSQNGNNNAYCQDNELSWIDWEHADQSLLEFTRRLIKFRKDHPTFRRRRFLDGQVIRGERADIHWLRNDGQEMSDEDWNAGYAKAFAVFLNGQEIKTPDARGQRVTDDSFTLFFNASHEPIEFTLWEKVNGGEVVIDTAREALSKVEKSGKLKLEPRSLVVLRHD